MKESRFLWQKAVFLKRTTTMQLPFTKLNLIVFFLAASNFVYSSESEPKQDNQVSQNPEQKEQAMEFESPEIHILAQPPDAEFLDEFKLPDGASKELIEKRNLIDQETTKLNQIADAIADLVEKSTFEGSAAEIKLLKHAQEKYAKQFKMVTLRQSEFLEQITKDNDKKFSSLEPGEPITEEEVNQKSH